MPKLLKSAIQNQLFKK